MPGPRRPNRLLRESSPYLLRHAHNPVDWFPWGDEAFAEAIRRDVPVFLSIGYSTCYWCHVMERECFEDEGIARGMNERFVSIKLDREERPDVDEAYMAATVIATGHGGWPMSVFLDPRTRRPFFCGTYFPPRPMPGLEGRPTFPRVLDAVVAAWRERREACAEAGEEIGRRVAEQFAPGEGPVELSSGHVGAAVSGVLRMFDRANGGFGSAPKFPQAPILEFLLDARGSVDAATRDAIDQALRTTLYAMSLGGVHDHVAGGFHRYAVDAAWTVPHFEKMLYDQAQMLSVYRRAGEAFGDAWYREVASGIEEYLATLAVPGGFIAAEDAEVDDREGAGHVWTPGEVRRVVPDADAAFALDVFGLEGEANFRDPHHPDVPPAWVLRMRERPEASASRLGMSIDAFLERRRRVLGALRRARGQRPQPRRDAKVIASWNGLAIAALTRGGAMELVRRLSSPDGLCRILMGDRAHTPALLEDYAALIAALATGAADRDGLAAAVALAEEARARCFDASTGAWHDSPASSRDLFVRPRSLHDGAMPCASTMMLHALIDLARATGERRFQDWAVDLLASISPAMGASPVGVINATRALLRLLHMGVERGGVLSRRDESPAATPRTGDPGRSPIEVYADAERVLVGPDVPAMLPLLVRLAAGYHVPAADPGVAGLVPFRVHVVGGTGVEVYADYPAGEAMGTADGLRVYRGEFRLDVALEAGGAWAGRPILAITCQPCTETECLEPRTIEIDVAIDRA